jgi:hypothetical protein
MFVIADQQFQRYETAIRGFGNHVEIRMGPGRDLLAGGTLATCIEMCLGTSLAQQRTSEFDGECAFTHSGWPNEQIATGKSAGSGAAPKGGNDFFVS